jgi:hypothetical protein
MIRVFARRSLFRRLAKGVLLLSVLSAPAHPALTQNASACKLPPNLVSPLETGPFVVSTYHTTGVAGSDRVIQVQWPRGVRVPISGVRPGRTDGAESGISFNIPAGVIRGRNEQGEITQIGFPQFSMSAGNGVDKYPLYSKLGSIGGMRETSERIDSGLGYTYHSSEGLITFPEEDHGDWIRYTYPNAWGVSEKETFFKGTPDINGVEAILSCNLWVDGPQKYAQCQIRKKLEPIFYEVTVRGRYAGDLPIIEYVADRLMECVLGLGEV